MPNAHDTQDLPMDVGAEPCKVGGELALQGLFAAALANAEPSLHWCWSNDATTQRSRLRVTRLAVAAAAGDAQHWMTSPDDIKSSCAAFTDSLAKTFERIEVHETLTGEAKRVRRQLKREARSSLYRLTDTSAMRIQMQIRALAAIGRPDLAIDLGHAAAGSGDDASGWIRVAMARVARIYFASSTARRILGTFKVDPATGAPIEHAGALAEWVCNHRSTREDQSKAVDRIVEYLAHGDDLVLWHMLSHLAADLKRTSLEDYANRELAYRSVRAFLDGAEAPG